MATDSLYTVLADSIMAAPPQPSVLSQCTRQLCCSADPNGFIDMVVENYDNSSATRAKSMHCYSSPCGLSILSLSPSGWGCFD
ncbi:hypothetical protein E2C01_064041 [Portunus trituberculatus]|uniref:Uncharacterized protein n=1 Tax=Portunus trituberculatus TaxID=210409 RepID=A0A5B7HC20_PORTR|nr:hypothetical protein [Portunus trituberculatus]